MTNSPSTTLQIKQRQKLNVLQVGRGYAALGVIFYHSWMAARDFIGGVPASVTSVLSQGYLGVDFFFVLSGFIILQVHRHDGRSLLAARTYLRKRALRIYVPYLPIGLGVALLYTAAPHLSAAPRDWSLLTSLTLFPTEGPPALSVAWTLVHEVTFYAIFLLFYATRRFGWVMVLWAIALTFCLVLRPDIRGFIGAGLIKTVLNPINLEFLFGMAACLVWHRLSKPLALTMLAIGVAGCVACVAMDIGPANRVAFGAAVTLMVAALVALEHEGAIRAWSTLVVLGDASYALYLVHRPLISVVVRGARVLHFEWWSAITLCVTASLIAGFLYNRFFENPLRTRLSKRFAPIHETI